MDIENTKLREEVFHFAFRGKQVMRNTSLWTLKWNKGARFDFLPAAGPCSRPPQFGNLNHEKPAWAENACYVPNATLYVRDAGMVNNFCRDYSVKELIRIRKSVINIPNTQMCAEVMLF